MSDEKILLTEKKNGVGIITLNRPDKLNAFNDELTFQLQDALKEMEKTRKLEPSSLPAPAAVFVQDKTCKAVPSPRKWDSVLLSETASSAATIPF